MHHVHCTVFTLTSTCLVFRLSILAQDMANVQSRVDDVNKAVKQLEDSRHPRTKEVKECQTRLNKRCFECIICVINVTVYLRINMSNYHSVLHLK